MLMLLSAFLRDQGLHVPLVLEYISARALGACITALLLVLLLGAPFIRLIRRAGISQELRKEECMELWELHKGKEHTPTMGGTLIVLCILLSSLLWMRLDHLFTWILLPSLLALSLIGGYDDLLKVLKQNSKGLSARYKLLFQALVSTLCALIMLEVLDLSSLLKVPKIELFLRPHQEVWSEIAGAQEQPSQGLSSFAHQFFIPFFKAPWTLPAFFGSSFVLTLFFIFVVTGSSNAVNLTDGLDGLAAGLLILCAFPIAVVGYLCDHVVLAQFLNLPHLSGGAEVSIFLSSLIGALIGFLWYNGHPAEIFMGDTGSLALGGILGICAILLRREFLLAISAGVFVIETFSVMLQVWSFKRRKKRIFLCAPLHHHFEYRGWHEVKVVVRFWICGGLLSFIALLSLKLQ